MDSQAYEEASYAFVHRDFGKAVELLGVIGPGPSVIAWTLYFALVDRAFIEPDSADWPSNSRNELRNGVQKALIWAALEERFTSVDNAVPPALILASFRLAEKYTEDPRPIVVFMEHVMALGPLPEEVFGAYITKILIGLQHDFYYARELVSQSSYSSKDSWLAEIDAAEQVYEHEIAQKLKWEQEQEQKRLDEAKQKSAAEKLASEQAAELGSEQTAELGSEQVAAHGAVEAEPAKAKEIVPRKDTLSTLTGVWKRWFHEFVRSQGLYNALIVVMVLFGLSWSGQARQSLARSGNWLMASVKAGIKMALSVTYL